MITPHKKAANQVLPRLLTATNNKYKEDEICCFPTLDVCISNPTALRFRLLNSNVAEKESSKSGV